MLALLAGAWTAPSDAACTPLSPGQPASRDGDRRGMCAPSDRAPGADPVRTADAETVKQSSPSGGSQEQFVNFENVARDMSELRDALRALQRELALSHASLVKADELAGALPTVVPHSGVLESLTRLEAATSEAGTRLTARWEREQAMRQRERELRELEAAQRARGVR